VEIKGGEKPKTRAYNKLIMVGDEIYSIYGWNINEGDGGADIDDMWKFSFKTM
jgi:hypothetical protein